LPWLTVTLFALHCLLELDPTRWQLDRTIGGEPWRLVTSHFVHWTIGHRFWDAAVFLVLGVMIEQRDRLGLGATIGLAVAACSATFTIAYPELTTYRGLSGVDMALAALLGCHLLQTPIRLIGVLLLLGLVIKIALELWAGSAIFADGAFVNVPWVHAAGAIVGAVIGLARRR
jgi:rhomboid family GlyGly-CTERM serine protease